MIEQQGMSLYSFFLRTALWWLFTQSTHLKSIIQCFLVNHTVVQSSPQSIHYTKKNPTWSCFLALFYMLLDSVCKYFVQDFCVCIHKRHWPGVFFSLSGFGIRVILALKMTLKSPSPPPTLFFFFFLSLCPAY